MNGTDCNALYGIYARSMRNLQFQFNVIYNEFQCVKILRCHAMLNTMLSYLKIPFKPNAISVSFFC